MIEQQEIDGRKAHVIYLDQHLNPVDKREAELIKVVFVDDHETKWLVPQKAQPAAGREENSDTSADAWRSPDWKE